MAGSWLWVVWLCLLFTQVLSQAETSNEKEIQTTTKKTNSSSLMRAADFRLPTSLNPLHYFIRLQPFLNGNFSIHGYTEITFEVLTPTSDIILHLKDIVTRNETLKIYQLGDANKTSVEVSNQTYDAEREFYKISLSSSLEADKKYVVQLQFVGYLNDKLRGFYRSSYTNKQGIKRWLAATQFQALHARKAFPCFDEPALRAEFTIELLREEGMTAISNMPKIETIAEPTQDGWFIDRFARSVKMSTYLVAFLISDLKYVSLKIRNDTLLLRVWAKETGINQTDYALQNAKDTILFFEDYFNITYPLPKMDLVALPDFNSGAMENWGLLAYREKFLLYDEQQSSVFDKFHIGSFNAHELAHMWFGNLVTFNWWSGVWLSEGFATYLTSISHDAVEPSFNVKERFSERSLQRALTADTFENSHPVRMQIVHPREIEDQVSTIIYSKAASLIRMMSFFLGDPTFKKGITRYLNEFAYSAAKQDDLWNSISIQAKQDKALPPNVTLKEIMDTWTLQTGFPVIHVNFDGNGSALLTQERFFFTKSANSSDSNNCTWWVPITFTSEGNPDFTQTYPQKWMSPSERTKRIDGMPPNDQWTIFNILQTGFYRVNYDIENWNRLFRQLNENHTAIHIFNRMQLIGDAFHLARADMIPYSAVFSLAPYLKTETELEPLTLAAGAINYLHTIFKYNDHYESLKAFLWSILIPHYNEVGFDEQPGDSYHVQKKRSLILPRACLFQYQPCLDRAIELYQAWMQNPQNQSTIPPSLRKVVYCTAIREGGHEEWEFAWNNYLTTDAPSLKSSLLSALGCTRNITIKENLMTLAFKVDGPIRKQDASQAFTSVIRDRNSSAMAWNYIQENFAHIHNYIQDKRREVWIIQRATEHILTPGLLTQVDEFIAAHEELHKGGDRNIKLMREKIFGKIKWIEKSQNSVVQWLNENGFGQQPSIN